MHAKHDKVVDNIARDVSRPGLYNLPNFKYSSWLTISDRLLKSNPVESYTIKALTYYLNGDLDLFTEYASKLYEIDKSIRSFSIYQSSIFAQGALEKYHKAFKEYISNNNFEILDESIITHLLTYSRLTLNTEVLEYYFDKFQNSFTPSLKENVMNTIKCNQEDIEALNTANIPKGVFEEVMNVICRTLSLAGNFKAVFNIAVRDPNDDVAINLYSEHFNDDIIFELSESWLKNIVEHESKFDFKDVSRLLVNFLPASHLDGVKDANKL